MLKSARIAVFVSGGGTNLQALLDAQRDGKIPHGEIALVISSQACAYALERAEKANVPAHTVPSSLIQHDFEAAFEYDETDSQLSAIEDIKRDMMRPVPMDRLLCGDVGFGKTEVALRGAFKAIEAGKQVALLVPTTILALQHYHTALSRMRNFPVKVEMLSLC